MANVLYGQNKADDKLDNLKSLGDGDTSVNILGNYLDYLAGYQGNLATGIGISDAEAVAGLATATTSEILACTLTPNALNTFDGTNSAAGSMCYLPAAILGVHIAMEITDEVDDTTGALPIKCVGAPGAASSVFAKQSLMLDGTGATLAGRHLESAGTAATPTTVNIIYTPAASVNNILGPGSVIHFYCPKADQWLVRFDSVAKGTGVDGAITIS
jgi:hypothetical protein